MKFMKKATLDFIVGIFVLIGISCILFLSIKVATHDIFIKNKNNTYILYANFNNIGSLKISAPVKISGFIIGKVEDIELNIKTYQAKVTLKLNKKYPLSLDTSAQILTTGLLGEQYIGLQSGSDDKILKNGDTITITSSALVLEDLIGKFLTNIGNK
jgi:phospholipid/cholesterol/gamma-HCH transport system substrate-binding protein